MGLPPSSDPDAATTLPLVVVDSANVVGSVPDGWWRDRHGATERLRDRLAALAPHGVAGVSAPLELVLVVEGAAKGVTEVPGVRVVAARGSGDDAIVEISATAAGRRVVVVTADRELRDRVRRWDAEVVGPRTVRDD